MPKRKQKPNTLEDYCLLAIVWAHTFAFFPFAPLGWLGVAIPSIRENPYFIQFLLGGCWIIATGIIGGFIAFVMVFLTKLCVRLARGKRGVVANG
jgi:hypothetical protein